MLYNLELFHFLVAKNPTCTGLSKKRGGGAGKYRLALQLKSQMLVETWIGIGAQTMSLVPGSSPSASALFSYVLVSFPCSNPGVHEQCFSSPSKYPRLIPIRPKSIACTFPKLILAKGMWCSI